MGDFSPQVQVKHSLGVIGQVVETKRCSFLTDLSDGPYLHVAFMLDAATLRQTDASCRSLREMNRTDIGPWQALGNQTFVGLELQECGIFDQPDEHTALGRKRAHTDWKDRFHQFCGNMETFGAPYSHRQITSVTGDDDVADFQLRLRFDILDKLSPHGVYLEVEVLQNPDNLSMALTDFGAGCSSITFSPDTGAVICEQKVCETPRKVEGVYIQALPQIPRGRKFCGNMGLYLKAGSLAFFRKCAGDPVNKEDNLFDPGNNTMPDAWETTGFISDLSWAQGCRLTPCLAFREKGEYRVRIVRVEKQPPIPIPDVDRKAEWTKFDWDVNS